MQLLFLLLLLTGPFLVITLLSYLSPRFNLRLSTRARIGLTLFFLFTGLGHFIRTEPMAAMLPPSVPYRVELIYLTGVFELLGAVGVWIPKLMKITGVCLILMMLAVLPANIYSAFNRVEFGGHEYGAVYLLVRVPFQLFVIAWTYFATEQRWWSKKQ
ncbi:MAG TPA: DoxX family protein [Pyrinomonadaceae bacterium]|nr:DoxX family protein [Pyrinomonadaceae bacterium]